MSRLKPDSEVLRGRLEHVLRFDVEHDGSLYLNALACVYLSCPEGSERLLCHELHEQAQAEAVDPDELLNDLVTAVSR